MYYYTNHIRIRESTYFERKHIKHDFEKLRFHSRSVSDRSEFRGLNKFPVEGTSSGSQPTVLDEFEAEIR